MSKKVFSEKELYEMGNKTYSPDATEALFLLGGIGTGNVSLGARGQLTHWELFNRPGKDGYLVDTFFSIYAKEKGKEAQAKVLESDHQPPFSGGFGYTNGNSNGLPRFRSSKMTVEYPFSNIEFIDDKFPVQVSLEAFTPFIPLNAVDSGIPCAIFNYKVKNTSSDDIDVSIASSIQNSVGVCDINGFGWLDDHDHTNNKNEIKKEGSLSGLHMYSTSFKENSFRYGSMSIMTPETQITYKPYWYEGGWWDGIQDFWDDFRQDGLLEERSTFQAIESAMQPVDSTKKAKVGSLCINHTLKPQEEKVFTFVLSWYFPNRVKAWDWKESTDENTPMTKNHYATVFKDSWDAGSYVLNNYSRLEQESKNFSKALYNSTLPSYVIDAAASNITVLRSTTCFRLEDGTFAGWEGCGDSSGCCPGSCTHVWNYAQTVAFLFPELEQTARLVEFCKETDEKGKMSFRTSEIFDMRSWDFHPATDGQMGTIIRLYREWKLTGDNEFLKKAWNGAKRALNFAFVYWDKDGDYVLESQQHNTYDIEFYGPSSLTNSMFFAALKVGAEMATAMGDHEYAEKYRTALEKGSKKMDELLWNGEYYIQNIDDINKYKYQYGTGCLSDQLLGQMLAHVVGVGYILPKDHVKKAVESVFKYNFMTDFYNHHNVQRTYALRDEKGLLLCSWPKGGRPKFPFVYSDEVWPGIEYQIAAHLIYEGLVDEGLTIAKAVRDRHDGYRRNPWNEVECGHHYVRSMASWALITALSGFKSDMVNKKLHFSPRINQDSFTTFWSTGKAWGTFTQKRNSEGNLEHSLDVLYGELEGVRVYANGELVR